MSEFSQQELDALGTQLQSMRTDLRGEIRAELLRADHERFSDLADQVHDAGEESVADMVAEINVSVVSVHIRELKEVESAIERMAHGHFGHCVECDELIPFARLQAYPHATRCITHQEQWEREHASK